MHGFADGNPSLAPEANDPDTGEPAEGQTETSSDSAQAANIPDNEESTPVTSSSAEDSSGQPAGPDGESSGKPSSEDASSVEDVMLETKNLLEMG